MLKCGSRQQLNFLVETARNVVASLADPWVIPWLTLKEQLILEAQDACSYKSLEFSTKSLNSWNMLNHFLQIGSFSRFLSLSGWAPSHRKASMVTLEEVDARLVECAEPCLQYWNIPSKVFFQQKWWWMLQICFFLFSESDLKHREKMLDVSSFTGCSGDQYSNIPRLNPRQWPMTLSIWAVYCSHRRPWNMSWSTWEKTCKHRRHCWNLWVRLEDVVFHCGLFYWILRWKLVLKRFLPFSEMPWKISGTFSGSFTDGCLLLVGSCQLKLLQAIDIPVLSIHTELIFQDCSLGLARCGLGPVTWLGGGFGEDGSHVLETDLGQKIFWWCPFQGLRWNPGNSQRLTVLILWLAIMWEMILTACGIGKGSDLKMISCQSDALNFWRLVVLCWDACYNSPCLWSSFYFKVLFGESWSASFWQGFRLKIAGNWLEDDISATVTTVHDMWMYAMQLDLPFD